LKRLALFAPKNWKRLRQLRQPQLRRLPPVQDRANDIGGEQRVGSKLKRIAAVQVLQVLW
jgi:hypothetical protein